MTDTMPLTAEERALIEGGLHIEAIKMIRRNRSANGTGRTFDLKSAKRVADEYRASLPPDHPAHPRVFNGYARMPAAQATALREATDDALLAECQRRGWEVKR